MAHTTRRVLLNSLICGGVGMALQPPGQEIEGAEARRRELYGLLGDLPPRQRPIGVRTLSVEERPGFLLEKVMLDINGFEPAPALCHYAQECDPGRHQPPKPRAVRSRRYQPRD